MQGEESDAVESVRRGECDGQHLANADRELLVFVEQLTLRPSETRREDIDRLRSCGWSDPQIAEAVYVTALFAFFNRVADAFGLQEPNFH